MCYCRPCIHSKEDDMAPRYKVTLTKDLRHELEAISTKGKRTARTVLYSRALLLLDAGLVDSRQ